MADSWNCIYAFTFSNLKVHCQTGGGLSSAAIEEACFRCATARVRGQIDSDLKYNDSVGQIPDKARLLEFGNTEAAPLERSMKRAMSLAGGGAAGVRCFEHFVSGGARHQPYLWHGPGSSLSNLAAASPELGALRAKIAASVRQQRRARLRPLFFKKFSHIVLRDRFAPLSVAIGGTKGLRVFVASERSEWESHSCLTMASEQMLRLRLRVQFCDHFGVDRTDLYTPGLGAFWILQHSTGDGSKYRPFVNILGIEETLDVPL